MLTFPAWEYTWRRGSVAVSGIFIAYTLFISVCCRCSRWCLVETAQLPDSAQDPSQSTTSECFKVLHPASGMWLLLTDKTLLNNCFIIIFPFFRLWAYFLQSMYLPSYVHVIHYVIIQFQQCVTLGFGFILIMCWSCSDVLALIAVPIFRVTG